MVGEPTGIDGRAVGFARQPISVEHTLRSANEGCQDRARGTRLQRFALCRSCCSRPSVRADISVRLARARTLAREPSVFDPNLDLV